jgi:hypothetical protein
MSASLNRDLVERWLAGYGAAWEGKDPAQLTALFDPEANYFETPFSAPFKGLAAIQSYWREAVSAQKDIRFLAELWNIDGDVAIAHWHTTFARLPTKANSTLDGVFQLKFRSTPSGIVCVELREWWHYHETT